mmetsp:Transcript_31029/g.82271  ORF Transcript_31029/g.82271 Transcript_31029/m.82271 type:complete len:461 (+) Transcript_31029:99-1481(+)
MSAEGSDQDTKVDDVEQQPLLAGGKGGSDVTKPSAKGAYSKVEVDKIRGFLGTAYMMAMGVCGVVLTAIGSTLDQIAVNCGTTSTAIGTVFLARGAGAIIGAVLSAKIYAPPTKGNMVMMYTMVALTVLLMYIPFIDNVAVLHFVFAGLGFCTAVTDTGCQIMTRKTQGVQAGPWLGANTVVFGIAGALVPLVDVITTDLLTMYSILSTISVTTLVTLLALPNPEDENVRRHLPPKVLKSNSGSRAVDPRIQKYFVTEFLIGNMVFWLIGGKVLCSSYIEDYVTQSGVIASSKKEYALLVVWLFIALGRFGGLSDQIRINRMGPIGIHTLYTHLTVWVVCGFFGGLVMWIWMSSSFAFWVSIVMYGFGNGPCVGYCYDLNNRLTVASEKGMSIVMFGLNFGASIVPYTATLLWDDTAMSYSVMPVLLTISMLFVLPFLYMTRPINDISAIANAVSDTRKP